MSFTPHRTSRLLLASAALAATHVLVGCATAPQTSYKPPAGSDQYVRAVNDIKAGNDDAAIAELEKAVVINPQLRMAQMTLGELYVQRKEFEKAVPHLEAASDLDPYTLRNHYNLGLSLQVLNRLQEAAMAYLRGLKLEPDDFKSNMNLGLVYFALNQLDPSIYYLERASRVEPSDPRVWSNIGVVYDARGNLVLAEASYRKALELDPDNESTLINLTANLIGQKKASDAVAIAQQLVKISDTALSRKRLGDAYTTARQWPEAIAAYDSAFAADKTFLGALNAKAEMFASRYETDLRLDDSQRTQAISTWEQSLKLNANQPSVKENLAKYRDTKVFK